MRYSFIFFSFLLTCTAFSQIINVPGASNEVLRTRKYTEFEGSAYLIEDWRPGTIFDKQGQAYRNIVLRYDIYKKNIEISSANGILLVSAELYPRFIIQEIDKTGILRDRNFVANINPEKPGLYLEELVAGTYSLFRQIEIQLVEETVSGYGTNTSKKVFQEKINYFIKSPGGFRGLKLTKASFIEAFDAERTIVEEYMQKEKLKMKSVGDLQNVLDHLNSLKKQ
jgi:hypothetical protein